MPHLSNCARNRPGSKDSCDCRRLHPRRYTPEVISAWCVTCERGFPNRCKKPNGTDSNGPHFARRQAASDLVPA